MEDRPPWEMDTSDLLVRQHERLAGAARADRDPKSIADPNKEKRSKRQYQLKPSEEHAADACEAFTAIEQTSDVMKKRLEAFCREYIIDWNMQKAFVRLGKSRESAKSNASKWFWHPYTQTYLVHLCRSIEERCLVTRNDVLAGLLKEANNYGMDASSATRIMAWNSIAKIMGMLIPRLDINVAASGVMRTPYGSSQIVDVDSWESQASSEQDALKQTVRD